MSAYISRQHASTDAQVQQLRQQIDATETQLRNLKVQLQQAEQATETARHLNIACNGGFEPEWMQETLQALQHDVGNGFAMNFRQQNFGGGTPTPLGSGNSATSSEVEWPLEAEEYRRYGRQLIMPEVGLQGQLRLKQAKVLVVGVGGLGCPAAAYLAGAGVGTLGLMDGDTVEASNLHRQIAHSTARVGMSKVDSAVEYLQAFNPTVTYNRHTSHLTPDQAISIFEQYDLILDCTDHPTSRYLISDACVLTSRPLISASALKTEGQLIVLNNPPRPTGDLSGGPCYRCIFPRPPPVDSVLSCGEGGILGPVVGVMGVLQALEALKVLAARPQPASSSSSSSTEDRMDSGVDTQPPAEPVKPSMLMFSAYSNPQFRSVRLRSRRKDCAACSAQGPITRQSLTSGSLDYVGFCGVTSPVDVLPSEARISVNDFSRLPRDGNNILIDVRDETQYAICALPGSVNVPWTGSADAWLERAIQSGTLADDGRSRYVVCRLGNDSQLAVRAVLDRLGQQRSRMQVQDLKGGLKAWRQEVDPTWPDY